MNKKDKIILSDAIDAIVDIVPGLNLSWKLSKAILDAPLKLRQQKALEWVEFVKNNPSVFTSDLLKNEIFQDGFVFLLEKHLRERNHFKRIILKNILFDFSKSEDLENYDLERSSFIASQLSKEHIQVLSIFVDGTVEKWEKKQGGIKTGNFYSCLQYGQLMLSQMKGLTKYEDENFTFEKMTFLAYLGLLVQPVSSWGSIGSGGSNDDFRLSEFGKKFIVYLRK